MWRREWRLNLRPRVNLSARTWRFQMGPKCAVPSGACFRVRATLKLEAFRQIGMPLTKTWPSLALGVADVVVLVVVPVRRAFSINLNPKSACSAAYHLRATTSRPGRWL